MGGGIRIAEERGMKFGFYNFNRESKARLHLTHFFVEGFWETLKRPPNPNLCAKPDVIQIELKEKHHFGASPWTY